MEASWGCASGIGWGAGWEVNFWAFVFVCILYFYNDIICLFLYFLLQCNKQWRQVLSHHICAYGGVTVLSQLLSLGLEHLTLTHHLAMMVLYWGVLALDMSTLLLHHPHLPLPPAWHTHSPISLPSLVRPQKHPGTTPLFSTALPGVHLVSIQYNTKA